MHCAMGHEDSLPWVWMNLILLKLQEAETGDNGHEGEKPLC